MLYCQLDFIYHKTCKLASDEELLAARSRLVQEIVGGIPSEHRAFLINFERGQPDRNLLGLPHAAALPAVRWRRANLAKLGDARRAALVEQLAQVVSE